MFKALLYLTPFEMSLIGIEDRWTYPHWTWVIFCDTRSLIDCLKKLDINLLGVSGRDGSGHPMKAAEWVMYVEGQILTD